ncbi:dead deah box helicase domain-containing protein, partial [Cystoisospora suis]
HIGRTYSDLLTSFLKKVKHIVFDEADRLLRPLRRYAPYKKRLLRSKCPRPASLVYKAILLSKGLGYQSSNTARKREKKKKATLSPSSSLLSLLSYPHPEKLPIKISKDSKKKKAKAIDTSLATTPTPSPSALHSLSSFSSPLSSSSSLLSLLSPLYSSSSISSSSSSSRFYYRNLLVRLSHLPRGLSLEPSPRSTCMDFQVFASSATVGRPLRRQLAEMIDAREALKSMKKISSRETRDKKPKQKKRTLRQEKEEKNETHNGHRKREGEQEDEEGDGENKDEEEEEERSSIISEDEREEMLETLHMFQERGLNLFDFGGKREGRDGDRKEKGEREGGQDDLQVYRNITEYLLKKKKNNATTASLQKSRGKDLIHIVRPPQEDFMREAELREDSEGREAEGIRSSRSGQSSSGRLVKIPRSLKHFLHQTKGGGHLGTLAYETSLLMHALQPRRCLLLVDKKHSVVSFLHYLRRQGIEHGQLLHEAFGFYSPRRFPSLDLSRPTEIEELLMKQPEEEEELKRLSNEKKKPSIKDLFFTCGPFNRSKERLVSPSLVSLPSSRLVFHLQRRERLSKVDQDEATGLLSKVAKKDTFFPRDKVEISSSSHPFSSVPSTTPSSSFSSPSSPSSSAVHTPEEREKDTRTRSAESIPSLSEKHLAELSKEDNRVGLPSTSSASLFPFLSSNSSLETEGEREGPRRSAACNGDTHEEKEARKYVEKKHQEIGGLLASNEESFPAEDEDEENKIKQREKENVSHEKEEEEEKTRKDMSMESVYEERRLDQHEREKKTTMEKPRTLLVTSMDTARGLHFDDIDVVFLVGRVESADEYQHLAGRTGRGGKPGIAICVSDADTQRLLRSWEKMLDISFRPTTDLLLSDYKNPSDFLTDSSS